MDTSVRRLFYDERDKINTRSKCLCLESAHDGIITKTDKNVMPFDVNLPYGFKLNSFHGSEYC